MFIKIMVDFGDMPKTMLPYALSLNPALPSHIQQSMIKQEQERRNQQTASASARSTGMETMPAGNPFPSLPTTPTSENARPQGPNADNSNSLG